MQVTRKLEALPPSTPSSLGAESDEARRVPSSTAVQGEPSVRGRPAVSAPFSAVLRGIGQELDRGESLAQSAIRGGQKQGNLSAEQLIALQAGIYRYSEALDLVTKVVDRGTQAVKTTLQNQ